MDRLERAQRLHKFLQLHEGRPVSLSSLCEALETGERTVRRLIENMRLYSDAPILNKPGLGYYYAKDAKFELPGVWFTPEELQALLTIQQFTTNLSGGFFDKQIALIQNKVEKLLHKNLPALDDVRRIRISATGSRSRHLPMFSLVATALLQRRCLHFAYYSRQNNTWSQREVSPQRLFHYKGNWYLDAWCHHRCELRTFALENIEKAKFTDSQCHELTEKALDALLTKSFGIFSGEPVATAVLRFTEKAARWVADEQWFPDEAGRWLDDGSFELRIPYAEPTELIMEICKHGSDVKVIAPPELQRQVAQRLRQAAEQYE